MTIELDLKIIKQIIQEMQKLNAADLEQVTNMARLQHDYQQSQLENLAKLCDHRLKMQEETKLEPERS